MLHRLSNIRVRTPNVRSCSRAFSTVKAPALVPVVVKQNRLQPHAYSSFDINFVGSGGSNPSRFRGMPCMTLFLGGELWMFDAGEGTVRQTVYTRSCMDVTKVFVTHMHADHIFGLPGVILNTDGRLRPVGNDNPLMIYGPYGLYEYLCTCLRLSENNLHREIIVHEMIASDEDAVALKDKEGRSPWRKEPAHYRTAAENVQGYGTISRVEMHSVDGTWALVDEPRITVTARLVKHRIPCFGFVVNERAKGGPLLDEECKKRAVEVKHFIDLKNGNDVVLKDGTRVKASEVTGPMARGRKLVYVGDTSDATNLAEDALDCDVLVHEASMLESAGKNAARRGHSTPVIASAMAKKCRAKRLILNHIGGQFLPLKSSSFHSGVKGKIRSDWELYEEARGPFGRHRDIMVARDFLAIKIPSGGYTSDDINTGFLVDHSSNRNRDTDLMRAYAAPDYYHNHEVHNPKEQHKQKARTALPTPKQLSKPQIKQATHLESSIEISIENKNTGIKNIGYKKVPIVNPVIEIKNVEIDDKKMSKIQKAPMKTEVKSEVRSEERESHNESFSRGERGVEKNVYNKSNMDKWSFNYDNDSSKNENQASQNHSYNTNKTNKFINNVGIKVTRYEAEKGIQSRYDFNFFTKK